VDERERRVRLEALFHQHAAAVRAYALRRSDAITADDAVMEVFVIACRRLDQVPTEPLPWLLACARRVLANQRRGVRRADALVQRLSVSGDVSGGNEEMERLSAAMAELRDGDREILLLSAWEGLEPTQIAEVLGCSRTAAAVRLYRARKRIAVAMGRDASRVKPDSTTEVL
jgi:RNA polymerase sigma factor (sigma-70 family)